MSEVYVVVRYYGWGGHKNIRVYLLRENAEEHAARLNGTEVYDPDDCNERQVWPLPFGPIRKTA